MRLTELGWLGDILVCLLGMKEKIVVEIMYSDAGIPAIWAEIFPCSHVHQASPANWVSAGKSQLVLIFFVKC